MPRCQMCVVMKACVMTSCVHHSERGSVIFDSLVFYAVLFVFLKFWLDFGYDVSSHVLFVTAERSDRTQRDKGWVVGSIGGSSQREKGEMLQLLRPCAENCLYCTATMFATRSHYCYCHIKFKLLHLSLLQHINDMHLWNTSRQLRSCTSQQLSVSRTKLNLGKPAFSVPDRSLLNELTTTLKSSEILSSFIKMPRHIFFFKNCISNQILMTTHPHFLIKVHDSGFVHFIASVNHYRSSTINIIVCS